MSQICITPPPELKAKILAHARDRDVHPARLCLEIVAERFGFQLEAPRSRPKARWVPPPKLLVPRPGGRGRKAPPAPPPDRGRKALVRVNLQELADKVERLAQAVVHHRIPEDEPIGGVH